MALCCVGSTPTLPTITRGIMKKLLLVLILIFIPSIIAADNGSGPPLVTPMPDGCKVAFVNEYPCRVFVMVYTADGRKKVAPGFYIASNKNEERYLNFGRYMILVVPEWDPVPRVYDLQYWAALCMTQEHGVFNKIYLMRLIPK